MLSRSLNTPNTGVPSRTGGAVTVLLAGMILLTQEAHAGGILSGRVNEVVLWADGGVTFNVDGEYAGRPACSFGNGYNRMVVGVNAPGNRHVLAAVLAAMHSGKGVTAVGTGTCNYDGGHEWLSYMHAWP
jgi:hypothetical protein